MVIAGAGGFARELLSDIVDLTTEKIFFFDDTDSSAKFIFNHYEIIHDIKTLKMVFEKQSNDFCLGVGNPKNRKFLFEKFIESGGNPVTCISRKASVGQFENKIGVGTCIMGGTSITNKVTIGKACLINLNCTIGHDSVIGDFSEICPGSHISGNVFIDKEVFVGTGAVILPNIKIGRNAIIGAGSVITKDIPEFATVVGIPGKIVRS